MGIEPTLSVWKTDAFTSIATPAMLAESGAHDAHARRHQSLSRRCARPLAFTLQIGLDDWARTSILRVRTATLLQLSYIEIWRVRQDSNLRRVRLEDGCLSIRATDAIGVARQNRTALGGVAIRSLTTRPSQHSWHGRLGMIQQPLGSEPSALPIVLLPYIGLSGWIRTNDPLLPRQVGTTRLPYTQMIWPLR